MKNRVALLLVAAGLSLGSSAAAEMTLSLYTGPQSAPHSRVWGFDPAGIGAFNFLAGWEGRSFSIPLHYGIRVMWWGQGNWGFGLDLNHNKIYADAATLGVAGTSGGFQVLEFTDGLNTFTANATYKWQREGRKLSPYLGAGLGVAIPHVEVKTSVAAPRTFRYQITGPAMMLHAGVEYRFSRRLSAFGELKSTYNIVRVKLDGGGHLNTNIVTNALNLGLTVHFVKR